MQRNIIPLALLLTLLALFNLAAPLSGQTSAYTALRVLGVTRGQNVLRSVSTVTATQGRPQPYFWVITAASPYNPSIFTEYQVDRNRVLAERPTRPSAPPFDAGILLLDSTGAFRKADALAARERISFVEAQYLLQRDPATGRPFWTVNLIDSNRVQVGSLLVNADDLSLKRAGWNDAARQSLPNPYLSNPPAYAYRNPYSAVPTNALAATPASSYPYASRVSGTTTDVYQSMPPLRTTPPASYPSTFAAPRYPAYPSYPPRTAYAPAPSYPAYRPLVTGNPIDALNRTFDRFFAPNAGAPRRIYP